MINPTSFSPFRLPSVQWVAFGHRFTLLLCGLACAGFLMTGCGGGDVATDEEEEEESEEEVADAGEEGEGEDEEYEEEEVTPVKRKSKPETPKEKPKPKRKGPMIGDIPLDVWDPSTVAVAGNRTPTGGGNNTPAPAAPKEAPAKGGGDMPAEKPAEKPAAAASSGGGDDWKSVISNDTIVDETKKIKARLTDSLQNVGKYNGNYKDGISVDGAVMATLAGIVIANPEVSVTWKGDAPHVRDVASEVSKKAKGLGQASFDPTKQEWDKLEALLSGNKPPGLSDAAPVIPFSEVAGRGPIMKRMEKAFQWMKSNIASEENMKKSAEQITNEASILAALAKVVATPGYNSADEDEYKGYVNEMIKANLDVLQAIKNEDFKAFTEANSRSQKACNDCHQDYRFAN